MRITRRHFLQVTTGAGALISAPAALLGDFCSRSGSRRGLALLDLREQCLLRESFLGYRKVFPGAGLVLAESRPQEIAQFATVIVPAAGVLDARLIHSIAAAVHDAGTVLFESAGGFLSSKKFALHQHLVKLHLDVQLGAPVELWSNDQPEIVRLHSSRGAVTRANMDIRAPYVEYSWPHPTKVRDFSRVVPVAAEMGDVFGTLQGLPVAVRKRTGKGTLIFLGSPLGPHLYAGDAEACRWLRSVLARG